jgi:TolB-like protein/tetratricopeptide (TPR) repeat protein
MTARVRFYAELKRRNVLRAAVLYVAAVWALAQGAAQLLPVFGAPAWIVRWFVIATIVGFPFWLVFVWFYELTPSGIKRESDVAPGESITLSTGRKLDFLIIGVLAVAVVLLLTHTFVLRRQTADTSRADSKTLAATLARLPQKSVAVLPLSNESGDPRQQYLSDGLSEELISDLTQISGLKVIGKNSSFKFRDSQDSPAQIGAALGATHLIQGSVRQQGDRIRVTVGMTRADDGSNVWSHSYDEQLHDVFAIQSRIGQAVAAALKVELLGKPIVSDDRPPSGNVEAYRLMLQGRAIARHGTKASYQQAIGLLEQALQVDPEYAYAWGLLAITRINFGQNFLTGDARAQMYEQARAAARRQQARSPDAATTHLFRGYLASAMDDDPVRAVGEYRQAVSLAPHDSTSIGFLANGLAHIGQLQGALALYRQAIGTDPLRADIHASMAWTLLAQGQLDAAEQATRKALALQPDYPDLHSMLARIAILRGDADAARQEATLETDAGDSAWAQAAALQIGTDRRQADAALREYIDAHGADEPYDVADLYALRHQPKPMFEWLQRAWTQRDPNFVNSLLLDPFVQPYRDDPRFAALCRSARLPLPGEALPSSIAVDASAPLPADAPATDAR